MTAKRDEARFPFFSFTLRVFLFFHFISSPFFISMDVKFRILHQSHKLMATTEWVISGNEKLRVCTMCMRVFEASMPISNSFRQSKGTFLSS